MTRPLRLDGAVATELQRRGVPVRRPWWTSAALRTSRGCAVLAAVHADYLAAGAEVITANTFRCNLRALRRAGLDRASAAGMVRRAVVVARAATVAAAPEGPVWIAGSMAPVEDCYRPDLVPEPDVLRTEHGWLARQLVAAEVDVVLVETMSSLGEARTALEAVLAAGGRAWVSLVAADDARLLSGERVADAVRVLERDGAAAVLVNCASIPRTEACLRVMREVAEGPIGAYPNVEDRAGIGPATHVDRHLPASVDATGFADAAHRWTELYGVRLVGGCCGTTPGHVAALRDRLTSKTYGNLARERPVPDR